MIRPGGTNSGPVFIRDGLSAVREHRIVCANFIARSDSVVKAALFKGTSAMSETKTLLCGHCRVEIEGRTYDDGHQEAVCPVCGQTDTIENAIREAGEYAAHELAKQFGANIADTFRDSDVFKVTAHDLPERSFRFIVKM
jgi:hypothetical protein